MLAAPLLAGVALTDVDCGCARSARSAHCDGASVTSNHQSARLRDLIALSFGALHRRHVLVCSAHNVLLLDFSAFKAIDTLVFLMAGRALPDIVRLAQQHGGRTAATPVRTEGLTGVWRRGAGGGSGAHTALCAPSSLRWWWCGGREHRSRGSGRRAQ